MPCGFIEHKVQCVIEQSPPHTHIWLANYSRAISYDEGCSSSNTYPKIFGSKKRRYANRSSVVIEKKRERENLDFVTELKKNVNLTNYYNYFFFFGIWLIFESASLNV